MALPGKIVELLGGRDLLEEGNCCAQALRVCFLRQDFKVPKPTLISLCSCGRPWTSDPPVSAGMTGLWHHIHFVQCWRFHLGLCACQESTLPTELHPQPRAWRSESLPSLMHALCFLPEDALRSDTSGSGCHTFPATMDCTLKLRAEYIFPPYVTSCQVFGHSKKRSNCYIFSNEHQRQWHLPNDSVRVSISEKLCLKYRRLYGHIHKCIQTEHI